MTPDTAAIQQLIDSNQKLLAALGMGTKPAAKSKAAELREERAQRYRRAMMEPVMRRMRKNS